MSSLRERLKADDLPELLKPEEVADYLGVSRNTVYRWCRSGDIESIKVRKIIRIQKSTLLHWIAEQERASCSSAATPPSAIITSS